MIRVMVVDEELPGLRLANQVLQRFTDVHVSGLFTDVDQFLERLSEESVDLVLLDTKMRDCHGLMLAQAIQACKENISIAFITAYAEYAAKAFDVDAIDYVLKPVAEGRLQTTLQRCRQRKKRSISNGEFAK